MDPEPTPTPTPTPTPAPQPTPSLNTNPGEHAWYKDLPDELKTSPFVQSAKDLATFAKMAVDTKSMVGANTIKIPGEKATPEEVQAYLNKLGRPETPEAYKPTITPVEPSLVSEDVMKTMTKVFHDSGLTTAQGNKILDSYMELLNKEYETITGSQTAAKNEAINALKSEWGKNFDVNLRTAQLAVREIGDPQMAEYLANKGLADDPVLIKYFHAVGTKLLDDKALGDGSNQFKGTPEAALAEINRLKADKDFMDAWDNAQHAGHKEAVAKWEQLHREAYPGKQKG